MQLATQTFNKILVVDDIEANIDILLMVLKDYDVTPVNSGEAALAIVEEKTVDLILLDIIMPTMSGFEVCERLKANDKTRDIPVIFFTVKNDEESMEQAYKVGGFDYVTKPFKPRELLARVRAQLKFQKMFHELKLTASRDKLTGIYNQQTFMGMAQNIYKKADNQLFMMILNIDAFQAINDQHGTYAGEQALKRVIWFITHLLPHNAILGRMDGAVFATLFQVATQADAISLAEKIHAIIFQLKIKITPQQGFSCTISSGIAQKGRNSCSLDTLFKNTNTALHQANSKGRNRMVFFTQAV